MIGAPAALIAVTFAASLFRVDMPIVIVEGRVLRPATTASEVYVWMRTAMRERGESMVAPRHLRVMGSGAAQEVTTDEEGFSFVGLASPPGARSTQLAIEDLETGAMLVNENVILTGPPTSPGAIQGVELPAAADKVRFTMGIATANRNGGTLVMNVPTRVTFWTKPALDSKGSIVVDDLSGLTVSERHICADGRAELLITAQFHTASLRMTVKDHNGAELGTAFVSPDVAKGSVEVNVPVVVPPRTERSLLTRIPSARKFAYATLRDPSGVLSMKRIGRDEPIVLPALDPGHYALTTTPDLGAETEARITYPLVVAPTRNLCDTALDRARFDDSGASNNGDVAFRGTSEGKVGRDRRAIRRSAVWAAYAIALLVELVGFSALMRKPPPPFAGSKAASRVPAVLAMLLAFGLLAAYIGWRF